MAKDQTIRQIAWGVSPGNSALSRPSRLVAGLESLGVIGPEPKFVHHGRTPSSSNSVRSSQLRPSASIRNLSDLAVLSPVFLASGRPNVNWIDFYDDWSLAPDINPLYRKYAGRSYRRSRRGIFRDAVITVNSPKMRLIAGDGAIVVPNGVDEAIAGYERGSSERKQLVVLGHFFRGRTDFALLERVALWRGWDEILLGGVGSDATMLSLVQRLEFALGDRLRVVPFISEVQLAKYSGPNAAALIPNIVNDYTASQDLMKAYTFEALGIPVICPSALFPKAIDPSRHLVFEPKDDIQAALMDWSSEQLDTGDRILFVARNSWSERVAQIASLISECCK